MKIEELSSFDIEYLFLNVRGKSVGETIDLIVTCGDDGVTQIPVTVPIDDIEVENDPDHSQEIKLNSEYTLKMKYPSLETFISNNFGLSEDQDEVEKSFEIIANCIDMVYDDENVYAGSETSKKEKIEWIESLTSEQFQMIEKFFNTMPKLSYTVKVTNPNTKKENSVKLEGLNRFFRLVMSHIDLVAYFKINFALMQFHKYSLSDVENMVPWERDIYVGLLRNHIEEENLKAQQKMPHRGSLNGTTIHKSKKNCTG